MEAAWRLGHRPGLDQLRGLAIALVLVGHAADGTPISWAAAVGVELFFVLSGFLITRLLIEERETTGRISLRRFYGRRARRLLPALPVALAVCAAANLVIGKPIAVPLVAAVTYTVNYVKVVADVGAFGHLWSLAVEEHFYLLWPLAVSRLSDTRRLLRVAVTVAVATAAWRAWFSIGHVTYSGTHVRVSGILVGAALAVLVPRLGTPSAALRAGAAATLALFSLTALQVTTSRWGFTVVAIATAVLVLAALPCTRRRPALEHLGRISYGVYLFSTPIWVLVRAHDTGLVAAFAAVALGVAAAEASHRLIEQRFLRPREAPVGSLA